MKKGQIGILNVGAGDTKISFDKSNPAERIRAARIVKDMLKRGYALLVEVDDGQGGKTHQRALDFDENTCEYIIADFDSLTAAKADERELDDGPDKLKLKTEPQAASPVAAPDKSRRGRPRNVRLDAGKTRGVAVARSAGG